MAYQSQLSNLTLFPEGAPWESDISLASGSTPPGGGGWFGEFSSGVSDIATSVGGLLPQALQFTSAGQDAIRANARAQAQATRAAAKAANRAERRAQRGLTAANISSGAGITGASFLGGLVLIGGLVFVATRLAKDAG